MSQGTVSPIKSSELGTPQNLSVSAFVLSYNEEDNIERCLKSLLFCDEIILIDSFSTDRTVELAKKIGVKVIQHPWAGYKQQKIFGLSQCRYDWVLNIDADEEVSQELRESILDVMQKADRDPESICDGYEVNRLVWYFDRYWRNGGWYPEYRLRFFRRSLISWGGLEPHEKPILNGQMGRLPGDLYHYTYRSIEEQAKQLLHFALLSGGSAHKEGYRSSLWNLIVNPLSRFVKFYILKKGFREGMPGFIVAVLEGYYAFLKYARMWEIEYEIRKHTSSSEETKIKGSS